MTLRLNTVEELYECIRAAEVLELDYEIKKIELVERNLMGYEQKIQYWDFILTQIQEVE